MVGCVLKEDHPPPSMCKAPRALGQSWQLCVIHLGQSLGGDSIPGRGPVSSPPPNHCLLSIVQSSQNGERKHGLGGIT